MKKVLNILLLAVLFSLILGEDNYQWGDSTTSQPSTTYYNITDEICNVTCLKPGILCGNCATICECRYINDELVATYQDSCRAPSTCGEGVCTLNHTEDCAPGSIKFPCSMEGVYPDPLSCKKYHYCVETEEGTIEPFSRWCETGYGYNPGTTFCDKILEDDQCYDVPVPYCVETGQTAAIAGNPTMYYICSPYEETDNNPYPFMFNCPYGKIYAGNYTCIDEEVV